MEQNACLKCFLTNDGELCKKECTKKIQEVDELQQHIVEGWEVLDQSVIVVD